MPADLQFTLGLDGRQFVGTINVANSGVAGLKKNVSQAFAGGATGAGQMFSGIGNAGNMIAGLMPQLQCLAGRALTVGAIFASWKHTIGKGDEIVDLAARIGESDASALRLIKSFKAAGLATENIAGLMNIMQRSLAGVNESGLPTKHIFDQIGLSIEELQKLSPAKQFSKIAETIAAIQNPAQRANAAMNIFGRSGGELLKLFNRPDALAALSKDLDYKSKLMLSCAQEWHDSSILLNQVWANAKTGFGFSTGFFAEFKWFDKLLRGISLIDFSKFGQWIGWIADRFLSFVPMLTSFITWALLKGFDAAFSLLPASIAKAFGVNFDQLRKWEGNAENGPTGWMTLWKKLFEPPKEPSAPAENSTEPAAPQDVADPRQEREHRGPSHADIYGRPDRLQQVGIFVGNTPQVNGQNTYERRMLQHQQTIAKMTELGLATLKIIEDHISTLQAKRLIAAYG